MSALCIYIRNHYRDTKEAIRSVDQIFASQPFGTRMEALTPDPANQTAVFIVGTSRGGGLHALLWVQRMFPAHFKNFIFVNARTVDSHAYGARARSSKCGPKPMPRCSSLLISAAATAWRPPRIWVSGLTRFKK